MESPEPYLEVEAEHEVEQTAHAADLHVSVRGSSLLTGRAALTQAREVNRLITALAQLGLTESAVRLQGVQARLSSGLLGKSSEAEYQLVLHCEAFDRLGEWIAAIGSQEQARLTQLRWLFPEDDPALLEACARKLRQRAEAMARGLDLRLGSLLSCRQLAQDQPPIRQYAAFDSFGPPQAARAKGAAGGAAPAGLDFQLQQVRNWKVRMTGRFGIAP